MNWGEESSCKGVAAVPGCPGQPASERTLQIDLPNYSVVIYCLPSHMLRPTEQGMALKWKRWGTQVP